MSDDASEPISKKRVKYDLPGTDRVRVSTDVPWRGADGDSLAMDVYVPPAEASDARRPAVVLVPGYPDPGMQRILGCRFKEMGSTTSWSRLIAASGMIAIAPTNRDPAADFTSLLDHLHRHASTLGIDEARIGLWAASGNAPVALSALLRTAPRRPACAAILYGCLLDLDGGTAVADAAKTFRFANPCAGRSIADLARDVPLLLVRAGRDEAPGLNDAQDQFIARAIAADLPLTVVNVPGAPHAFDLVRMWHRPADRSTGSRFSASS